MKTGLMNMNGRYRRGWFGDSHRHYLAAKGISTKRYFMPMDYSINIDKRKIKKFPDSDRPMFSDHKGWEKEIAVPEKVEALTSINELKKDMGMEADTKVNWRKFEPDEVVEWQTPKEFVANTHGGADVDEVAFSAPHYADEELGIRPTHDMPIRMRNWKNVELLHHERGSRNDGRHRAWSANSIGEDNSWIPTRVPVVVDRRKRDE